MNSDAKTVDEKNQDNLEDLVDAVDSKFSVWRVPLFWIWVIVIVVLSLFGIQMSIIFDIDYSSHASVLTTADIALLAVTVAVLSALVSIVANVRKWSERWIIDANYKRLLKTDFVLYGLIVMKTQAPKIKLRDAYGVSPELFDRNSILKRVYRETDN